MKSRIINKINSKMKLYLDENQLLILDETLRKIAVMLTERFMGYLV